MGITRDDIQGGLKKTPAGRAAALGALHARRDAAQISTAPAPINTAPRTTPIAPRYSGHSGNFNGVRNFLSGKTNIYGQRASETGGVVTMDQNRRVVGTANRSAKLMSMDSPLGMMSAVRMGLGQLSNDIIYNPSGVYHEITDPIGTTKAIGRSTLNTIEHPTKNLGQAALLAYGGASGLAGLRARVAAASVADGTGATTKALLSRPVGGSRVIYNAKGEKTLALNSDNPLARPGQRLLDRVAGVDKPGVEFQPGARAAYQYHRFRVNKQRADTLSNAVADAQPHSALGRLLGAPTEQSGVSGNPYTADLSAPLRVGNRLSRATVLYGKLGYGPTNELGNEWLGATQQGALLPLRRAQQMRLRKTLGDLGNERLNALSGTGEVRSSQAPVGNDILAPARAVERGVDTVDRAMGGMYARVIDTPQRRSALVHELARGDIRGPEATKRGLALLAQHVHNLRDGHLTDPIPTGEARKTLEAGLRSNQAMINYDTLGPIGKPLRDAVFFAPWLKGSSLYLGHYLRDHPLQAALAAQMGNVGQKKAGLGQVPSIMDGMFKVGNRNVKGLGKVPLAVNPTSSAILTQPVQIGQTLAAMAGLSPNKPGVDPTGNLTPMLYSALAAITHKDPFTGHQIPQNQGWPQIFANQYANMIPLYQMWKGGAFASLGGPKPKSADPTRFLFPRTARDKDAQFLLSGLAPTPVNPVEQQSRYRAETTAAETKLGAATQRGQWFQGDLLTALNRLRAARGAAPLKTLPAGVAPLANYNTQVKVESLKVAKMSPNAVSRHGSLTSVGSLAARYRVWAADQNIPQARIDAATQRILAVDPTDAAKVAEVKSILKEMGVTTPTVAGYSMGQLVKMLNAASKRHFPYANGGAPISVPSAR